MMDLVRHWLHLAVQVFQERKFFPWPVAGRVPQSRIFSATGARCLMRRAPVLLGWPGMAGIGLMTACAAFYFSTIQEAQEKFATARVGALAIEDQLKLAGHGQGPDMHAPEEQVAQFYRMFPRDSDLPQCLEKIFSSAESQGIGLDRGEYKVIRDKEGGLVRFQMTFPVKGSYPSIRKYLSSLMADMPTLSLQQVKFKRQKVGDATVEANINLVLFLLERKS